MIVEPWVIGLTEDISPDEEVHEWRTAILEHNSEVAATYGQSDDEALRRARTVIAALDLLSLLAAIAKAKGEPQ